MDSKKESIFSKILKPKASSCCSMEIIEEPDKSEDKRKKQVENKED